jgi:hypothetical protein
VSISDPADPSRFWPERFLERKFGPHEWFPFGGGNRVCLGMPFALYEMKVLLATHLSEVRPSLPAGVRSRAWRYGIVLGRTTAEGSSSDRPPSSAALRVGLIGRGVSDRSVLALKKKVAPSASDLGVEVMPDRPRAVDREHRFIVFEKFIWMCEAGIGRVSRQRQHLGIQIRLRASQPVQLSFIPIVPPVAVVELRRLPAVDLDAPTPLA